MTSDKTKIAAANLAQYRAVTFVNSAGDVLDDAQESDLQNYVQQRRRLLRPRRDRQARRGQALLRHADRPDRRHAHDRRQRGLHAGRRVPRPRASGDARRTAARHQPQPTTTTSGRTTRRARSTPSRACASTRSRSSTRPTPSSAASRSPTTPCTRFTGGTNTLQPQQERALSWCRDIQQGRSFYTGMGQTPGAYDDALRKHMAGAIQWSAGMVRGGCKATITSNYTQTRLTPSNPTVPAAAGLRRAPQNFNPYMGEIDALAMAAGRPRVLRRPRRLLPGPAAVHELDAPADRPRLRPDLRLGSARRRLVRPEPEPHHQGRRLHGARRQGRRQRDRRRRPRPSTASSASRSIRSSASRREPQLHLRRLPPVLRRHDGPQHGHQHGPGLRPRRLHGRASPLAASPTTRRPRRSATSASSTAT